MIKHWIITGDTHGGFNTITRVSNIQRNMPECKPEETGIIILGDAGLNFYLNKTDKKYKKMLNGMGFRIYCVRGNHEQRPELVSGMTLENDFNVGNMTWVEPDYPNIRYFADGGNYVIGDHPVLVVGGAYSVDKFCRLTRAGYSAADAETADPKKCGWFKHECLTKEEMDNIIQSNKGKKFDFVFTHTAPIDWEPTDLFLHGIDQSKVDKSMELWLKELADAIKFNIWLFGHYHADRIEAPHVEQFYTEYEELCDIIARWKKYDECGELDWWIPRSPRMKNL